MINIKEKNIIDENDKSNLLKICLIVLFGLVIFILGFLFHKSLIKLPRKMKANELNDEYDYQNVKKNKQINKDFDINNNNANEKRKSLFMELGTKII